MGANLVENLTRAGFGKLKVIDRIEERNLSTQPYYRSDVGAFKAKILAKPVSAIGTKVEAETQELAAANSAQLLRDSRLIVDVFDNSTSRQAVKNYADRTGTACLMRGSLPTMQRLSGMRFIEFRLMSMMMFVIIHSHVIW